MNQQQKKIAEIIKRLTHTNCKITFGSGMKSRYKFNLVTTDDLILELANHFKEEDKRLTIKYQEMLHEYSEWEFHPFIPFNRKQFLKACGVQE